MPLTKPSPSKGGEGAGALQAMTRPDFRKQIRTIRSQTGALAKARLAGYQPRFLMAAKAVEPTRPPEE
jgi:hypothetical protein